MRSAYYCSCKKEGGERAEFEIFICEIALMQPDKLSAISVTTYLTPERITSHHKL
jgi:hypothetical protein